MIRRSADNPLNRYRKRPPGGVEDSSAARAFGRLAALVAMVLLLAPLAAGSAPSAAPRDASPGRHLWALLVGIDRYDNPDVTPLRYAESDARLVASALVRSCGFPADHVFLLTSRGQGRMRASRPNLVDWLVRLRSTIRPQDTFVFFFAGHGISLDQGSYLLPVDAITQPVENLEMSALKMASLRGLLQKIPAARILIAVDACRNDPRAGRGTADNKMTTAFARDLVLKKTAAGHAGAPLVEATLYACRVGQRSYEWPEKGHGFFSYYLAQGLGGDARDASQHVTLHSLMDYLDRHVPEQTRLWGTGAVQTPWAEVAGSGAGGWILSDAALANQSQNVGDPTPFGFSRRTEGNPPAGSAPTEEASPAPPPAPPPEKALEGRAQAAFAAGRLADPPGENAIELARETLKIKADDAVARELEARAEAAYEQAAKDAAERKDYDRALAMYRRLAALYPQRTDFQAQVAQLATPPVPDITGVWQTAWGPARFKADGTCAYHGFLFVNISGHWSCLDARKRLFQVVWNHGYTDTVTLSDDATTMVGSNQNGEHIVYRR